MVTLFDEQYSRRDLERLTGRTDQIGGITPLELADGRARSVPALRFDTGAGLSFTALAGRTLDLAHAHFQGIPLCWRSLNGDAAASFYDPTGERWLRMFFGGLLTTCGLTNFGPPGEDSYGAFGLHGPVNCLPSEDVRWSERWEGDECILEVEGTTRQTRVFGEDLWLHRRISTQLGSRSLRIHDIVINHGFERQPHMILYHCNLGFPILSPGAELYVSHREMRPRDGEAVKGIDVWNMVEGPQPGFKEQVFIHQPVPCDDGRAAAVLINHALPGDGLGLAVRFDPQQLPAMIQWRMLGESTYVMGLEPANCPTIQGRVEAARRGTLPFLDAGESRQYEIEVVVLPDRREVEEMVAMIEQANQKHGTTVQRRPDTG